MKDQRFLENPFFVLGLRPDAERGAPEREGKKLLAQLELGVSSAKRYATPFGPRDRTPELVREAMATLRDPDARCLAELWAKAPLLDAVAPKAEGE